MTRGVVTAGLVAGLLALLIPASALAECDGVTDQTGELLDALEKVGAFSADEFYRPPSADELAREADFRTQLIDNMKSVLAGEPALFSAELMIAMRDVEPWMPRFFYGEQLVKTAELEQKLVGEMFAELLHQQNAELHKMTPRERAKLVASLAMDARYLIVDRHLTMAMSAWAEPDTVEGRQWKARLTDEQRTVRWDAMVPLLRERAADLANALDCSYGPCYRGI